MSPKKYKNATSYQFSALRRYPLVTLLSLALALVSSILSTLPMVVLGQAINELQYSITNGLGLTPLFFNLVLTIVLLGVGLFVSIFIVGYAFTHMVLRWERDARQEFFDTIQENSMAFHDQIDSKTLLAVAMQDIMWIRFSLNPALRNVITSIGSILVTAVLLYLIDPILGLVMGFGIIPYFYFALRYANTIEPVRRKRAKQNEKVTAISQEVFRGIEVVRAFGNEEHEKEKFNKISVDYKDLVTQEGRLAAFYVPTLVMIAITGFGFIYGINQVLIGTLLIGDLTQIIGLLTAFDSFAHMLPRLLLGLKGGNVNAQRIVDLLDWKDPLIEPKKQASSINWEGDIVFDNVSFRYNSTNGNKNSYALKNINFKIPGGSKVALIGGPGGGKSTILKLLLRFYDVNKGTISIGGEDIKNIKTESVRDAIRLVEQDVFLFRMSIRDNIAFGNITASEEDIIEASKRAQAHEFILKTPKGYDTLVGERGATLSGGQKQRIAIARTIVQDPKILCLDDSVSAIDSQTEYYLRKALAQAMVGKTSITVTQRLRTLLESDLVIIVDKGEIVAIGTHQELLKKSMHYQRIFERLPGAKSYIKKVNKGGKK
ncbi:MAG: ABC transporter ATP-binding protein [Candidatus Ranarchaeia archaeon]